MDASDMLTVFRRIEEHVDQEAPDGVERTVIGPCRFVPLIGREGYPE
jgi:hypothetical protein